MNYIPAFRGSACRGILARWSLPSLAAVVFACGLLTAGTTSWCHASGNPWWDESRVQLKLLYGRIEDLDQQYGTTTVDSLAPLYLQQLPEGLPYDIYLSMLSDDPRVDWAEPAYLDETPEGTRLMVVAIVGGTIEDYLDQNVYERIHLDAIHEYTLGDGVTVALLDTGVDFGHVAFDGVLSANGWDFVSDDSDPSDEGNGLDDDVDGQTDEGLGHGTMVGGIVHLVAPEATLLPIRVLDDEGRGDSFDVARGIRYAVEQGAAIINLSLGLPQFCHTIEHELAAAASAGVILVAAAGNDNTDNPPYFPASDARAYSVAALDSLDVKASFSNYHSTVDVSAPGDGIRAPFAGGEWAIGAGTSFAAPFISGQAALIRSVIASPPDTQSWDPIRQGVVPIDDIPGNEPYRGMLGSGRFDGLETLEVLQPAAGPTDSPSETMLAASPNPAGRTTVASVAWDSGRMVRSATVHDVMGRWIAQASFGHGRIEWDGRDRSGQRVAPGHYYLRIQPFHGPPEYAPMVRIGR